MLQRGTIFHPSIFIIQLLFIPHFALTLNWKKHLATSDYITNDAALASIWLSPCRNNPELQHQKIAPANIFMNQSVCEAWPLHFSFHPPLYRFPPHPPHPLLFPPVRDRLTHMNHLSVTQLLTPLQSGPPEIDGTVKGWDEHRVPVWDQHQQTCQKKNSRLMSNTFPKEYLIICFLQIYI